MKFRFFRLLLLRWHRRIGLLLMVFVTLWVVSGIAINHGDELGLDQRYLASPRLLAHYGIDVPELRSFAVGNARLSGLGEQLFLNEVPLVRCRGHLQSAVHYREGIAVLCEAELLLLTETGGVLDQVDAGLGLPSNTRRLAGRDGELFLEADQVYRFDSNGFGFEAVRVTGLQWAEPAAAEEANLASILGGYRGEGVSWERLLLDLHSGRFFGRVGVLVVDIAASLLFIIAIAGVWVWLTKPGRWHHP